MKIVILAGGKGTRLGLTDKPKPMVPVAGRPLLERLVDVGKAAGFSEFVFLNGHLAEVIEEHFGDGSRFGVQIEHVTEPEPLGTAGAIRHARHLLTEPFIVLYGDVLIDLDLKHMAEYALQKGGLGTLFVHPNDHPHDSDLVLTDDAARITAFLSKPHAPGQFLPNLVSGAIYVLAPGAIDFVPEEGSSDWGKDIFPAIIDAGKDIYAYRSIEYAKDVGTPERLKKGESDLASGRVAKLSRRTPKPAIFYDRDGVLNVEIGGVHQPDALQLIASAGPALKKVNRAGIPAICVTNQPDLAKGMFTFDDLRRVFAALDTALAEHGAYLDDTYFCPHHPEKGWPGEVPELKIDCECRKPGAGMLKAARDMHNLDLEQSWIIGDKYCDIAAIKSVGGRGVLVRTGHNGADRDKFPNVTPDFIADDVGQATDYILERMS